MTQATQTLPTGYKQTEIGMIPAEWEGKKLVDIFQIEKGQGLSKSKLIEDGSYECILYGELFTTYKEYTDKIKSKTNIFEGKISKSGDILLPGSTTTTGVDLAKATAILKNDVLLGGDIIILRSKNDIYNSVFLSFSLTHVYKYVIAQKTKGTTIHHLHGSDLVDLKVYLPTKPEQIAIATAVSNTDALIENLKKLIAKKKAIKQGAMQQLLTGKKRLPGFSGEWEVKKLVEIANIKTGGKNNQDKSDDGLYPFFVRSQTVEKIKSYSYDCEAILVPGEGNIGNIFHYISGKFDVHQRVYAITNFYKEISGKFIFYYMKKYFGEHAMRNTVKATVDSLRLPTFENFVMFIPPTLEEQTAIATVLSGMDTEIEKLENKLGKYRQIKTGMMQQLLTGKIRLVKN